MTFLFRLIFSLSILILPISQAWASGLSKPVLIGPKAVGMGGAFVGIADDPSAIFHNPAGITQMKGHNFQIGSDSLITDEDYTPPGSPVEKAKTEFIPVPFLGYTTDFFKPMTIGFGLYFPHGNGGKFTGAATNSAAPLNPNEGRIYSMEIAPTLAYELSPKLSIGASLRVVRVSSALKGQLLIPPLFPVVTTLNDLDLSGWGLGASAGLLYKPCTFFQMGANYRSTVNVDLNGTAAFSSLGTDQANVDQPLPTTVSGGFGFFPMEGLTLGLTYDWENNSEIDNLNVVLATLAPTGFPFPQNYKDSHTIHVGGEYWIIPTVAVRAGYAKDLVESIPDTSMNRIIGDIAAHEVSLGLAYNWERYKFGLTWNARFGERDVPVTATNPAPGNYDAFVQMINVALGFSI